MVFQFISSVHMCESFEKKFLKKSMATIRENKFHKTIGDSGFFKEYYNNFRNVLTDKQLQDFELLKTDEERVRFVYKIAPRDKYPPNDSTNVKKNLEEAKSLKEKGNREFGKNNNKEALKFYSDSALLMPNSESTTDLAIILANRSAALYHLNEYEKAISDIDWALDLSYPKDLRYKIFERKAKCLLALNRHEEALAQFRKTLQALDDSKLNMEKKLKMQTDIQIMLGIMTKPKTKANHINAFVERQGKPKKVDEDKPKLCSNRNKVYESGCDKFEVLESDDMGRYASATAEINAGDTLLIENPFCSVLMAEKSQTHCTNCFTRTMAPYPCRTCCNVIFCSSECRKVAESTYHKYECPILENIHRSGASVTVLMALRIEPTTNLKKYTSSDYSTVYHLVRHENERQRDDFLERTLMGLYLLHNLKKTDYFKTESNKESSDDLTDEECLIGELLLRHLQMLQFNAHEIFELEMIKGEGIDQSKSIFIGGGIYPTLALFNHSCDPGIIRYFTGATVIARAIKPIRKGEMIAENYGPLFTRTKKQERQAKLKSQYWFTCKCIACTEDWPLFDEMDKKVMRFRCDSRQENGEKSNSCNNAIAVPIDTAEFMVQCLLCHQRTNIFKGLKILQDTDAMFKQASRDVEKGNYRAALAIYLEILSLLDSVMVPPFADYHICQQAIRKCMLTMGNKYYND